MSDAQHPLPLALTPEARRRLFESVVVHADDAILVTEAEPVELPGPRIVYVNDAFTRMTGYRLEEVFGQTPRVLQTLETNRAKLDRLRAALKAWRPVRVELLNRRKDGREFWVELNINPVADETGWFTHWVSIQHDITERKRAEANLRDSEEQLRALTRKLAHDANHDALTGLPNRSLFEDRLEAALDRARRTGLPAAVLFVDLDRFKRVNDTLGHHAGDELLRQAARRLAGVARRDDTVCRRGGDEFLMVLAELRDPQDAARAAQRLLDALLAPFEVDGRELVVSASVGLALFPQDGADASTLQRHADVAMYRAKANGADRFECFTPDMNETAHERLELEGDLRRALEHGDELEAYYQPLIDPATGAVVGLEALVRWRHPRLGLLEPARFLPVAEESSLIGALGVWMLGEACRQNAEWQRRGLRAVRVAVNVSALQFDRGDLTLTVARALEASGLESRWLELELTETLVTRAPVGAAEQLERLRALGVSVAVDDFGTGYSSLGQLRRLPTDALKIDRSFIAELAEVASAESLVEAMIVLGRSLGMRVVAEGVETSGQLDLLRSLGCDEVQGFLFARPMPADALEVFLAERLKATA